MSTEVIQLVVENHDNFIYIVADRHHQEALVIDPAWDAEGINGVLMDEKLNLSTILITHAHHDHVNAVEELYTLNPQASIFIHEQEYPLWQDCPNDVIRVQEGDEIAFGNSSISVISTPGHTPGACCYHMNGHLFTGDTLFVYGCGRADLRGGNPETLFNSLQKLKKLPPATKVWVGHDYGSTQETTLAEQCRHNPFLMIDRLDDFVRFRMELAKKYRHQPYTPMTTEALQQLLAQK